MFDVIIVGGGSAGCVLANRLSENPRRRVLLMEAGQDTPPNREPDDVLDSYPGKAYLNPTYTWPDLHAYLQPVPHNENVKPPLARYEQAKIMGGGSSINGQVASRGLPDDYDEWARLGAAGWSWNDVLPYFLKIERDLDFDGPNHGKAGPMPIRRVFPPDWDGLTTAAAASFEKLGYAYRPDLNDTVLPGFSPAPFTNAYGSRVSTAMAYLTPLVRARRNLEIRAGVRARRVVFRDGRAAGVEILNGSSIEILECHNVLVSAGAIHTPALLLRSGVGQAAHLKRMDIPVAADLPGVGLGLQDHSAVSVSAYLRPANRFDEASRRHIHMHLRYTSGLDDGPPMDMVINTASRSAWHPLGRQLGSFQIFVGKPFSRGSVQLNSPDHLAEPEVRFELLSDYRDKLRLMEGVLLMNRALRESPLRDVALDPFPSSYSSRVRTIGRLRWSNLALTAMASCLMEGSSWSRRAFIRNVIRPTHTLSQLEARTEALDEFVTRSVTPTWHACATCRMGADEDRLSVADSSGKVRGLEGLWIADTSLMPSVPRGNTGLPVIMLAEKVADKWKESQG